MEALAHRQMLDQPCPPGLHEHKFTPHGGLTCGMDSKSSGVPPNKLSETIRVVPRQLLITTKPLSKKKNDINIAHGTTHRAASSTKEVKVPAMTTGASLPPPAPTTVPSSTTTTSHSSDGVDPLSTKPNVNNVVDDNQCDGRGEVDAATMSLTGSSLQEACAAIHDRVSRFLAAEPRSESERRAQEQSKIALEVISQALEQYEFNALSLSYNGGKDCLVLLILYLSALHTHYTKKASTASAKEEAGSAGSTGGAGGTEPQGEQINDDFPASISSIYAKPPDPFPQVTSFVETSTKTYHLSLTHISTNPGSHAKYKSKTSPPPTSVGTAASISSVTAATAAIPNSDANDEEEGQRPTITFRDAFALYLNANPQIRAIFVGTRRTDPHGGKLTHFDMTDGNWPRFMRIHPVIDWHLRDVWTFLRHPALADPRTGEPLQYCSIYDLGYTSLGGVGDTLRNPKLMYVDQDGSEKYRPAYEMTEDLGERLGRE